MSRDSSVAIDQSAPSDAWIEAPTKAVARRRELAMHTLDALSEFGFAKLNLREVAARSGVSLGVIHYHFEDKTELLCAAISLYKEEFVKRLDACIAAADDADTLRSSFAALLCESVELHGRTHRLWYDVRAQAMFEPAYEAVVAGLEEKLISVVGRLEEKIESLESLTDQRERMNPLATYLAIDGWFRYALQQFQRGERSAIATLRSRVLDILSKQPI